MAKIKVVSSNGRASGINEGSSAFLERNSESVRIGYVSRITLSRNDEGPKIDIMLDRSLAQAIRQELNKLGIRSHWSAAIVDAADYDIVIGV